MKRPEVDRMRALLVEAITTLCRSGLQYNANLKVEGLIGITLDEADIILVNLNKTFGTRFDEISVLDKTPQDEMATNDGEYDDKSLTEPLSPRERSRQDKSKKRHLTSTPLRESKKSRQTPTKEYSDNESKSSPQVFTDRVDFSRSPESQNTGDRKTDSNTYDGVPSASSVESALTTTEKSVPDNNSSSQQDSASNQDSRLSNLGPQHEGPVVKIEIDSDPEIEEVKVEPAPSQSCSRVPPLPYQTQVSAADNSLHNTFPQDFPQTIPSLSASDLQGELFASQLPPEFTAATQSDSSAVPIGMFSNTLAQTQPIAGPSGLSISSVTGASYVQGDSTAARQGSLQQGSPGFKTKTLPSQCGSRQTDLSAEVQFGKDLKSKYLAKQNSLLSKQSGSAYVHKCRHCGKVFRSLRGKVDHERSHEGKYRYHCPLCSKGFMTRANMEGHFNNHQNSKPFKCAFCHKAFAYKTVRNEHAAKCNKRV